MVAWPSILAAVWAHPKRQKRRKRYTVHEEHEDKSLSKPGNRKILQLPGQNHGSSSTENGDAVLIFLFLFIEIFKDSPKALM